MKQPSIKNLLSHFGVFGKSVHLGPTWLKAFQCPGWMNPVMSPIFLKNGNAPSKKDIIHLERNYLRLKLRKTPYERDRPYFCVTSQKKKSEKETDQAIERLNYTYIGTRSICFHNHVRKFSIPRGFTILIGEYFDRSIHPLIQDQFKESFSQDPLFRKEFDRMIKHLPGKTYSVIIQNEKKKTVASGLFTLKDSICCLWSGSVSKKSRGNGFSRLSIEVRKAISAGLGAKSWIFFTHNPLMENYFDYRIQYRSYARKA